MLAFMLNESLYSCVLMLCLFFIFRKKEGHSYLNISVIFLAQDRLPLVIHQLDQLEL